jgi:hypothetical protein
MFILIFKEKTYHLFLVYFTLSTLVYQNIHNLLKLTYVLFMFNINYIQLYNKYMWNNIVLFLNYFSLN